MSGEVIHRLSANRRAPLLVFAGSVLFVTAIIAVSWYFGIQRDLVALLEWVQAQGAWSVLIFVLIMALVVVLLMPGIFFTTGAGFVFGIIAGTTYVVLGTTLGGAAAFLIARHLSGPRAQRLMQSHQNLHAFTREAARHAFAVVLLTRLIPVFPFKVSNYLFGLAKFPFRPCVLAAAIGVIPYSLHNVYLGSLAADLAQLSAGTLQRTPWQWAMYGLGFIAIIAAVTFFSRLAKSSLAQLEAPDIARPGSKHELDKGLH